MVAIHEKRQGKGKKTFASKNKFSQQGSSIAGESFSDNLTLTKQQKRDLKRNQKAKAATVVINAVQGSSVYGESLGDNMKLSKQQKRDLKRNQKGQNVQATIAINNPTVTKTVSKSVYKR
jgi:polygalacturonase